MKPTTALLAALPLVSAVKVNYDGYQVVRLPTHAEVSSVRNRIADVPHLALNLDTGDHLDIAIAPENIAAFKALGLDAEVLHEDLGNDIKAEGGLGTYSGVPDEAWFDEYHSYEDHLQYIEDLQAAFGNQSELITSGESFEGRPIQGIHLWGSGGKGSNPAVLWHGTVHAREWITPKTTEFLTYQLISGYLDGDSEVVDILDKYDFYVFPVVNPDGFVHSYESDRLWRKSRQPRDGASCIGTDINRNWPYKWEVEGGASDDPCSETYRGEEAGDTPENQGLVSLVEELAAGQGIKQYIDWHSYGQYLLLPFGYDCDATAENHDYQLELATQAADIIQSVSGTQYTFGASCGHLYPSTGGSVDFVTAEGGAEVAWTVELRPNSQSGGGFVLPADEILPTVTEIWEAFRWLLANQE